MDVLPGGLRRVTMPLPTRPGYVHCYLLPVDGGYLLVDTGLGLPDARERWAAELSALDGPVVSIFLSHFHPDHLGAAVDVQALTGARVLQGRLDAEQAVVTWAGEGSGASLEAWFHRNGVPRAMSHELSEQMVLMRPFIRLVDDPILLEDGMELHGWEVVAAPGHADGQLTLLRDGVLIAADHLLAPISPTVGLWPESSADPLGDYFESLRDTIERSPAVAYSGHGEVIHHPAGRAKELLAHHGERLDVTAAALGRTPRSGYDVSFPLFGDDLDSVARRFAVAETLSHLERLVLDGRAERVETEIDGDVGGVSYTAAQ
jgi:glyoxylase-like metal-dependent hydrolase (beta-lactamase superfamily II)